VRDGDAQGKANAAAVLGSQVKKKIISKVEVEELMDEVQGALTDVREIQEAMGRQLDLPRIDDDDELLAELERMTEDDLTADLSKVDLDRAVEMPSAHQLTRRGHEEGNDG
jgi:hypothetical protein